MTSSIKIAKIMSTRVKKYSVVECDVEVFDEERMNIDKTAISCLSFQIDEHLMKHCSALLVSTEEYDEYVDPFVEKIKEAEAIRIEREKKAKNASLSEERIAGIKQALQGRRRYLAWLEDFISDYAPNEYKNFQKEWHLYHHGGRDDRSQTLSSGKGTRYDPNDNYVPDEAYDERLYAKQHVEIVLSDEEHANSLLKEAREDIEAIERLLR